MVIQDILTKALILINLYQLLLLFTSFPSFALPVQVYGNMKESGP